jgi:hypothetical protein
MFAKIWKMVWSRIYTLFYEKFLVCTKTPETVVENHSLFNPLNLRYNFATLAKIFRNVPYTRQSYIKGETGYL